MEKFDLITLWQAAALYIYFTNIGKPLGNLVKYIQCKDNFSRTNHKKWMELYEAVNENNLRKIKKIARSPRNDGVEWPTQLKHYESKVTDITE